MLMNIFLAIIFIVVFFTPLKEGVIVKLVLF
jgi:hypothetical protein